MAASSPYSGNDYQALGNYRPYKLPVNDIFKAFVAQDQFWDEGAQRVKSVYDEALNLKLSLEPNKQIRDKFLKEAEAQLTKLSGKNVGDPTVQREGFGIFKELFKDEGIVYDDAMTRHYEKVRQDALSYREDEDGKGYSDTNLSYALDGYNDFVNSKDRFAGKKFYQGRKEYTPFYDPTSELNNILKNCKPSTATNESVQGYYIKSYSDQSLTSAKINTCLDGGLSDRAKRQLQINGYVTYKNNPMALRDKYVPHLNGTISQLQEESSAIKGVLANKDSLKNLKKEDLLKIGIRDISEITPELIKTLEDQVKLNDTRTTNLRTSVGRLIGGDLSDIIGENYESIAGAVYSRDYMQNVAEGFSYNFSKNSMKSDPVQMMFYQQAQQNARQEDQQQHDLNKFNLDLEKDLAIKQMELLSKSGNLKGMSGLKGALGQGTNEIIENARILNDTNSPFTSIDKSDSYDQVTLKRQSIANEKTALNQQLIKNLKKYGLDSDVQHTSDPRFDQFYKNFQITSSADPEKVKIVDKYYNEFGRLVLLDDLLRGTQESVDKKLAPIQIKPIDISGLAPITLKGQDGSTRVITPEEVLANVTGQSNSLGIEASGNQIISFLPGQNNFKSVAGGKNPYLGQTNAAQLNSLYMKVRGMQDKKDSTIRTKRNELMQNETVLQREGYLFPFLNDDKESDLKKRIAQELGISDNYIGKITIGQTDLAGRLLVTLAEPKKGETDYDKEGALEKLKRYGGRDNKTAPDNENTIVLEGLNELTVIDEKNTSSFIEPYVRTLENEATTSKDESTPLIRSLVNKRSYRLEVSKNYDGTFDYRIIDSEKVSPVMSFSERKRAVAAFTELTQKKQQELVVTQ